MADYLAKQNGDLIVTAAGAKILLSRAAPGVYNTIDIVGTRTKPIELLGTQAAAIELRGSRDSAISIFGV